jgi:predicted ferric reductase
VRDQSDQHDHGGFRTVAGWLAVIFGLSFYARKWIGVKTWRWMHRFTIVIYLLALGHVVGAGTHGRSWWMLAVLSMLTTPIVFAFTFRILPVVPRGADAARTPACTGRARRRASFVAEQP